MELECNYEIARTANFIYARQFTRVALQFPDELLKDSTKVVKVLRNMLRELREGKNADEAQGERKEVGLYVMADTTYGSCCVDEVGASHIYADCVVHYGHTCLSPTSNLPAFFVFGKAPINALNCAREICSLAEKHSKPVLVLFGLEFAHAIPSIKDAMVTEASMLSASAPKSNIHFADVKCTTLDPLKDQAIANVKVEPVNNPLTGEICSSEVGTSYSAGGLVWSLPLGRRVEDFLMFWIGADNAAFAHIVLAFNGCQIVRYGATENGLVADLSQQNRILKRRYYLVEKAKDANIVGILVGTLGVAGYLHMIHQMKDLIIRAGKKPYTLVMGKPNPAKLANFPECDVFVFVSCAQTALLDSKEFLAPVITPFEAILAFDRGSQWTGAYTMEFRDLINLPSLKGENRSDEARFSFIQGGYVEDHDETADEKTEEALALAVVAEKALQVRDKHPQTLIKGTAKSGAEFLAGRSYQGLDVYDGDDSVPKPFVVGRTGRAAGYEHEG